jgi:hypothetical protein
LYHLKGRFGKLRLVANMMRLPRVRLYFLF